MIPNISRNKEAWLNWHQVQGGPAMKGRVIKRKGAKNYTIILQLGLDPATGKRKQKWIAMGTSKREAEQYMTKLIHELDTGSYVRPNKETLGEYIDSWFQNHQANISPTTAQSYVNLIKNHIKPGLGHIPLTALTPEHLQRFYSSKLKDGRLDGKGALSNRTVRYLHCTLHRAFKVAVMQGKLYRNPADAVESPKDTRREMHTMDEVDMHLLLETARSTPYYALFYLSLFTGMRRSELLGLRWCDVDLVLSQLSVTRTLHLLNNGDMYIGDPKSAKGKRLIALSPSTVTVLKEHKGAEIKRRLELSKRPLKDQDPVFTRNDGSPLKPASVTQAWRIIARKAGIGGIRLHDARHTHASFMLKAGTHPKIVQERLGHASIRITLDTYSHVAPGLQEAAAKVFDDMVLKAKT